MADEIVDQEEATLAQLEAEEAAAAETGEEEAGAQAGGEPAAEAEPEPEPAAAVAVEEPVQQPQSDEIRIPKARLDHVLGQNRALELENARLKGLAEGVKQGAQPAPTAAPAPDPILAANNRILAIESEQDVLWKRYDAGEITYTEVKQAERKLDGEATQIRTAIAERQRQPARPAPQAPDVNGDVRLAELTEQIANNNAWIGYIPAGYLKKSIVPLAEDILAQRGIQITGDAVSTFRLRQATVEVAKAMGAYKLFAPQNMWPEEGQGAAAAPQPTQAQVQRQPAQSLTAAQVKEKLELGRRAPPDMGSAGTRQPGDTISLKDTADMTEEELAELGEETLERLAPSHAR